ncbi:MAG: DUF3224 domain-containing protein [Candidatus Limnocylindrales bacterium]
MAVARGTFEISIGGEDRYETLGEGALAHAWGEQRFSGDIVGDGAIHWLMAYTPDRTARYVGLQRISGTIDGRAGTIVIEATGAFDGTTSKGQWSIVTALATGDLAGVSGTGSFTAGPRSHGTYELRYRLRGSTEVGAGHD